MQLETQKILIFLRFVKTFFLRELQVFRSLDSELPDIGMAFAFGSSGRFTLAWARRRQAAPFQGLSNHFAIREYADARCNLVAASR